MIDLENFPFFIPGIPCQEPMGYSDFPWLKSTITNHIRDLSAKNQPTKSLDIEDTFPYP
jgi:hypothetical protein